MQHEEIRKILENAIKIELAGRETYRRLIREIDNTKIVSLLRFLEFEEESHYQELLKKYKIYGGDSIYASQINLDELNWLGDLSSKNEKEILEACIEGEKKNAEYYENAAAESGDPIARDFFNFLGQQERQHVNSLKELLDGDTII